MDALLVVLDREADFEDAVVVGRGHVVGVGGGGQGNPLADPAAPVALAVADLVTAEATPADD